MTEVDESLVLTARGCSFESVVLSAKAVTLDLGASSFRNTVINVAKLNQLLKKTIFVEFKKIHAGSWIRYESR